MAVPVAAAEHQNGDPTPALSDDSKMAAFQQRLLDPTGYPTPPASFTSDDLAERNGGTPRLQGIQEEVVPEDELRLSTQMFSDGRTKARTCGMQARDGLDAESTVSPFPALQPEEKPPIRTSTQTSSYEGIISSAERPAVQSFGVLDPRPPGSTATPSPASSRRPERPRPMPASGGWQEHGPQEDRKHAGPLGVRRTIADRRLRAGSLGLPSMEDRISDTPHRLSVAAPQTARPSLASRTVSTPPMLRRKQSHGHTAPLPSVRQRHLPPPLFLEDLKSANANGHADDPRQIRSPDPAPSPMPPIIPLPPVSLHTYLQLELSSEHPSPLYIHRSAYNDFPYESSAIKFQRICNFLLLPLQIERVLWFGTAACCDAWLYNMTILPLRFFKALWVLLQSLGAATVWHAREIAWYVYTGWSRTWRRYGDPSGQALNSPLSPRYGTVDDVQQSQPGDESSAQRKAPSSATAMSGHVGFAMSPPPSTPPLRARQRSGSTSKRHRRTKSQPSNLLPANKADILKGLLILLSCIILQKLDASQMYHDIKGQSAIKLYGIYSVLDVSDRLLSALGQDVLECLCSRETLERKSDGRSKVLRPAGIFTLALAYNVIHSSALLYQVITLNVAVNSYSNALLTLLISTQFVEIKSTVFKKFEKENLFQLTCADVVERFQLAILLTIIALRNVIEMGLGVITGSDAASTSSSAATYSMLPQSFTMFPAWTGRITGPFLLVLGSEMLVDWLKHAYIGKFNNTKPAIYGRYLDVLAKDYYTNAFADQNLTKRLGLPVIPLSCLAIRTGTQLWHNFLANNPRVPGSSTSPVFPDPASGGGTSTSEASLRRFDSVWIQILHPSATLSSSVSSSSSSSTIGLMTTLLDRCMIALPTVTFALTIYLLALTLKLLLGMALLHISRNRYHTMKEREMQPVEMAGKRVGGWGVVEVDADKRRWIYEGDVKGMREMRERERATERRLGANGGVDGDVSSSSRPDDSSDQRRDGINEGAKRGWGVEELKGISRWNMSGKRIW